MSSYGQTTLSTNNPTYKSSSTKTFYKVLCKLKLQFRTGESSVSNQLPHNQEGLNSILRIQTNKIALSADTQHLEGREG